MPSYIVSFPHLNKHVLIEEGAAANEADAINLAFERMGLNARPGEPDKYYHVECQQIPR